MPPSEINDENRRLGRSLASRLMEGLSLPQRDLAYDISSSSDADAYSEIYLSDVLVSVEALTLQVRLLDVTKMRFPCVRVRKTDEPIPLSLGLESMPDTEPFLRRREEFERFVRATVERYQTRWENSAKLDSISINEATYVFTERLSNFLGVRFNARQSDISADPGTLFSVHCSHGLRAYYTPTYWLQVQHVLSYPTSPAKGWVQPGRYFFGAAKLGQLPRFDFSAYYDVPPDNKATLPF